MQIKNKTVWITGASSGIGKALALACAREQAANIIISARRESELQKVKEACLVHHINCGIVLLDLSDPTSITKAVQSVKTKFNHIDILIHNGGISQRALVKDADIAVDRRIMEVNFFGAVQLTKQVLPLMMQQSQSHIAVISSVVGKFGFPLRSAYAASKHALHGFFDSLRLEMVKYNLGITMICPGRVKTDIAEHALTADGSPHKQSDKAIRKGMDTEKCARKIIKAIKQNKHEVYIGGKEVMMVWFKRYLPQVFFRIVKNIAVN